MNLFIILPKAVMKAANRQTEVEIARDPNFNSFKEKVLNSRVVQKYFLIK